MTRAQQGYALDLATPVRHVATMIADAAPAAISVKEMAATYKGIVGGDIHRVRVNEKLGSDAEATEWLLEHAVQQIMRRGKKGMGADQIVRENGIDGTAPHYRLADGIDAETLEYDGKLIGRDYDAHKTFRDPFNPLTGGIFSENIRAPKQKDDLAELCESIEALGYVKDPGIVKDERKVVLSGHRRLEALEKLGIDPADHVTIKRFGDGDEADMERLKFAIALNTAQKPFTPKDLKRIAVYLYGTGEWSMERIGELLKVSRETIRNALAGVPRDIVKKIATDGRRMAAKGSREVLKPAILAEIDAGATYAKTAAKFGVGKTTVDRFVAERKRGSSSCQSLDKEQTSSSKIPEDQKQAFFKLVFDDGCSQAVAYTEVTGQPALRGPHPPKAFITAVIEERGRRQALAEIEAKQAAVQREPSSPQPQQSQHQCHCPQCGNWHTFTPKSNPSSPEEST
jgi:ParB-like chromosome segregation protein Spo0J